MSSGKAGCKIQSWKLLISFTAGRAWHRCCLFSLKGFSAVQRANKQERNEISSWGAEQVVMNSTFLQGTVIPARSEEVFPGGF